MSDATTDRECELAAPKQPSVKSILREMTYTDLMCMSGESSPEKVYTLDLHGHKIDKISNLEKFTHLRSLDLSCNLLEEIGGLDGATFLCELKLYSNRISEVKGLHKLKNLVLLSLQMNNIANIEKGLRDLGKLEMLRLDLNSLTQVDASIHLKECNSLTDVNLSHNRIQTISNFSRIHKLEKLDLSHNLLTNTQGVASCNCISELILSDNKLSGEFEIPLLKCLQSFDISNNFIQEIKVSNQFKHLSEIQCNNNKLESLPQNLKYFFPQLQILELKGNAISDIKRLCLAVKGCQHLSSLLLDNNPILEYDVSDQIRSAAPTITRLSTQTPSSMCEVRMEGVQIETTFKEMEHSMNSYEDLIQSTIESMQSKFDDPTLGALSARPSSRCHSRARLNEALEFASKHFKS